MAPLLKNMSDCLNYTTVVGSIQVTVHNSHVMHVNGQIRYACVFPDMDWNFVQHPTNMTVTQGENVTVTCKPPYSRPTAQVSWFKNNQLFIPTDHVTVLPSGDLFFQRCVCVCVL